MRTISPRGWLVIALLTLLNLVLCTMLVTAQTVPLVAKPGTFPLPISGDCSQAQYWQDRFFTASDILEKTRLASTEVIREKDSVIRDQRLQHRADSSLILETADALLEIRITRYFLGIGRQRDLKKAEAYLRKRL